MSGRVPGGKDRREMLHLVELMKVQVERAGIAAMMLIADRSAGEANIAIVSNLGRETQISLLRKALATIEATP